MAEALPGLVVGAMVRSSARHRIDTRISAESSSVTAPYAYGMPPTPATIAENCGLADLRLVSVHGFWHARGGQWKCRYRIYGNEFDFTTWENIEIHAERSPIEMACNTVGARLSNIRMRFKGHRAEPDGAPVIKLEDVVVELGADGHSGMLINAADSNTALGRYEHNRGHRVSQRCFTCGGDTCAPQPHGVRWQANESTFSGCPIPGNIQDLGRGNQGL